MRHVVVECDSCGATWEDCSTNGRAYFDVGIIDEAAKQYQSVVACSHECLCALALTGEVKEATVRG